ncbi:MAG: hypothetical protein ACLFR7_08830 [Opitutales bacterium]
MMKQIRWTLVGLLILTSLLLDWFGKPNAHPRVWDQIPFFYGLLGFGGALLLIWLAKGVIARFAQKPEDYYERNS